jgi:hypothetical protein
MSAQIIEFPRRASLVPVEEETRYPDTLRPEMERSRTLQKVLSEVLSGPPPGPEQLRREYFLLECD